MTTFTNWTFSVAGNIGPTGPTGTVSLASPAFTGTPTAPTASAGTNTTQLATTEFVTTAAAGVTSGFRNLIINGDMRIAQRGTSFTANGSYTADRWIGFSGNNAGTIQIGDGGPVGFSKLFLVFNGGTTTQGLRQRIESTNAVQLRNKQVNISMFASQLAASPQPLVVRFYYPSATDNWSSRTLAYTVNLSAGVSFGWNRYSGTTSGVFSADVERGLEVEIDTTGGFIGITGVQLEANPQPTPFEQRLYGTELALCQRYYEKSNGLVQVVGGSTGFGGNTYWSWVSYKVEKRVALNLVTNDTSNGVRVFATDGGSDYITMYKAGTQYYSVAENFEAWTTQGFSINTTSGQTDAGLGRFYWNANAEL